MTDWKKQAAMRRDFRQKKADLLATGAVEFHGVRPWPGRKDVKRWCRGKPGVEHQTKCMVWHEWITHPEGQARRSFQLVCTACGKRLACWWPSWNEANPRAVRESSRKRLEPIYAELAEKTRGEARS